jgi:hypothetical protein
LLTQICPRNAMNRRRPRASPGVGSGDANQPFGSRRQRRPAMAIRPVTRRDRRVARMLGMHSMIAAMPEHHIVAATSLGRRGRQAPRGRQRDDRRGDSPRRGGRQVDAAVSHGPVFRGETAAETNGTAPRRSLKPKD